MSESIDREREEPVVVVLTGDAAARQRLAAAFDGVGSRLVQALTADEVCRLAKERAVALLALDPAALPPADLARVASALSGAHRGDRFAAFIEHLPGMAFMKDAAGRYVYANQRLAASFGLTPAAILGRTDADVMPPDLLTSCAASDARALAADGPSVALETMGDGVGKRHFLTTKFRVPLPDGTAQLGGFVIDVTREREVEEGLRRTREDLERSETRLRVALETARLGTWDYDPTNGQLECCPRTKELLGVPSGEAVPAKATLGCIHADDLPRIKEASRVAFQADGSGEYAVDFRAGSEDGSWRWLMARGRALHDASGLPRRLIGTVLDITERKRAEESLARAAQEAEKASRIKSNFLAQMSHEIRTPLNAILGFAELLESPRVAEGERARYLGIVRRNGTELARLVDDILDLAKVEAGKLVLRRAPVALGELLADVAASLDAQARAKELELTLAAAESAPALLHGDRSRLRQVLMNIVGNAVKYTARGRVQLVAETSAAAHGPVVTFTVIDTGKGIPPELQAQLFQVYTRVEGGVDRTQGTGLGLTLARQLARVMGGDVTLAASEPGCGSTFLVTIAADLAQVRPELLERAVEDVLTESEPPPPSPMPLEDAVLDGMSVLVVDDRLENQLLASRILRLAGATVTTADNGREGIERALGGDVDLVLMDLQMPGLSGYEAARELRERGFTRPIIALSAHAMREERERSAAAGCDGHLAKPITAAQLLGTLAPYVKASKSVLQHEER